RARQVCGPHARPPAHAPADRALPSSGDGDVRGGPARRRADPARRRRHRHVGIRLPASGQHLPALARGGRGDVPRRAGRGHAEGRGRELRRALRARRRRSGMSATNGREPVTKSFPVFDCDAHINDPDEIWTDWVEPEYRELVRRSYWKDGHQTYLNGRTPTIGGAGYDFPGYNPICIAGPQMSKKIARRLQQIGLTAEQKKYVEHPGAYDPKARLREMDLMGIDQVMLIPTMMVANFPFVENLDGAYAFARAYNNWVRDYCAAAPDRLFPAGWLPLQSIHYTCCELEPIVDMRLRRRVL